MKHLYHFTAEAYLPRILRVGISMGSVTRKRPTDRADFDKNAIIAPWLTEDPNPSSQQWTCGSPFDKTAVRLDVAVPTEGKPHLIRWREWANELGVHQKWYRTLDKRGGYGAKHWWVYRGVIPPNWIKEVRVHGRVINLATGVASLWKRRRDEMERLIQRRGLLPYDLILEPEEQQEFGRYLPKP